MSPQPRDLSPFSLSVRAGFRGPDTFTTAPSGHPPAPLHKAQALCFRGNPGGALGLGWMGRIAVNVLGVPHSGLLLFVPDFQWMLKC